MAATVAAPTQKHQKIYRATLRDEPGVLAKIQGEILFFNDLTGTIIDIEPEDCVWLCVLAEMGLSETQYFMDQLRGGYPTIACTRDN